MQNADTHLEINQQHRPLTNVKDLLSSEAFTQAMVAMINHTLEPGTRIACGECHTIITGMAYASEAGDIWIPTRDLGAVHLGEITSGGVEIDVNFHHDEPMAKLPEPINLAKIDTRSDAHAAIELMTRERQMLKDEIDTLKEENEKLRANISRQEQQLDILRLTAGSAIPHPFLVCDAQVQGHFSKPTAGKEWGSVIQMMAFNTERGVLAAMPCSQIFAQTAQGRKGRLILMLDPLPAESSDIHGA